MNHWDQLCKCGHRKGNHGIRGIGHCPVRLCKRHGVPVCEHIDCLKSFNTTICPCENFEKAKEPSVASKERKALVELMRLEGRLAFTDGKNIDSCPYSWITNRRQWIKGYKEARDVSLHTSN